MCTEDTMTRQDSSIYLGLDESVPALRRCAPQSSHRDPTMLLAEALATRKDNVTQIDELRGRLSAAVVRYEDQEVPAEDPDLLLARLSSALDRFESLTILINKTNNETRLTFDARELNVMEAIALRERLVLEAKARRVVVEALEAASGTGKSGRGRGFLMGRRTKDDLRELPTVDLGASRYAADQLSETLRRLDLAIQQRNWTTPLQE
jgi:hypothetical protein